MLDGREIGSCRAGRRARTNRKYIGRNQKWCKKYGKETYSRERMKATVGWSTNWLESNALIKFLKSNVGKNWDKVFSELTKRKLPWELMTWVDFYVEKSPDGIHNTEGNTLCGAYFYICPKTNRLLKPKS